MADKNKLIDINGLTYFKEKMDSEIDQKISQAGSKVTKEAIEDALGYTPADEDTVPVLKAGTNMAITIDEDGKTVISSPVLDEARIMKLGQDENPYYYLAFQNKELAYKYETEVLVETAVANIKETFY